MTNCYILDYPRPQFVRKDWQSLNGKWKFAFDDKNLGVGEGWPASFPAEKDITVPFSYETEMSGIGQQEFHPVVWYQRSIAIKKECGKRAILHFEGSDFITDVWVNNTHAGQHKGGYTRFSFDITELSADGDNTVTVRVQDSLDPCRSRGKQRWKDKNFGCWYVQTTGIWKTVWLEYRPESCLDSVKMTPCLIDNTLKIEWQVNACSFDGNLTLRAEASFDGVPVCCESTAVLDVRGSMTLDVYSTDAYEWGVKTWSPDEPNLYDLRFTLLRDGEAVDEVGSYFGMRDIRIEKGNILLNGVPLYQRLMLDQGYWADSHLTPPDEDAIKKDIDLMLDMGFNGVRKHQKIEDSRFAYWCDVKGLLMWCESPSAYEFGDGAIQDFTEQWLSIVEQHYNHPSIITWVPFNESWGVPRIKVDACQQRFTEGIYYLTKSMDSMRPVISNDGWEHTISDIITLHDYEELGSVFLERYADKDAVLDCSVYHSTNRSAMANGYRYTGQPVIISEYGGAAFSGGEGDWGYGSAVSSVDGLLHRIEDMTSAIKKLPWVCGYCYTQLTDVQQEINGLADAARNPKMATEKIREINLKIVGDFGVTRR